MIFELKDREALITYKCSIYRFSKMLFEQFPNGEYGSESKVAAEERFLCLDCIELLKAFGYQVLLLDNLEKLVHSLLLEDIPFESEGFEPLVIAHRRHPISQPAAERLRSAVRQLRELPREALVSVDALTSIIRCAGVTYDGRDLYGDDAAFMVKPPGGLYQSPRQLAELLVYLSNRDIKSVIEIGAGAGWTTVIIATYLERFNPSVRCVGIDIKETFAVESSLLECVPCEFRIGTSAAMQAETFDFCYIDGDHSYGGVKADFETVGYRAAICAFHDIHDQWCPDVRRVWLELRQKFTNHEFRGDLDAVDRMGIGVLELR